MNPATVLDFVNLFFAGMLSGIEFVNHYGLRVLVLAFFVPTAVLGLALTVLNGGTPGFWFRCAAVLAVCAWILIRVVGTVPINSATADWQLSAPPENWKELVNRAERFHIVGVWAAVLAFAFFLTAVALKLAVH